MNNSLMTTILLGLLLLLVVSPFATLAPLVLIVVALLVVWMGSSLLQTLFTGRTETHEHPKR